MQACFNLSNLIARNNCAASFIPNAETIGYIAIVAFVAIFATIAARRI